MTQAIVYTKTDESPMMSTYSLFPSLSPLSKGGIALQASDISLQDVFWLDSEYLEEEQRVEDALENLGNWCKNRMQT